STLHLPHHDLPHHGLPSNALPHHGLPHHDLPSYGDRTPVLAIAHRGGSALGPENTVPAFERSLALGLDHLETDVRVSADGVCVAFHDRDLRRVTGSHGRVEDLSWAQISRLRVLGSAPVPRLDELLSAWPQVRWVLDVKQPAAIDALLRTVRATGTQHRICLSGTWDRHLDAARESLGPAVRSAIGWASLGRVLAGGTLGAGSAEFVHLPLRLAGRRLPEPRLLARAQAQSLRVVVWGVDTAEQMHRLLDDGVDGIITDHPDVLREVLIARGAWAPAREGRLSSSGRVPA
uniref:glycerophosphodiester phosphodiesterase family protein n=1 Tax=Actinotalea sp. TaxID=1872145 RepID=UPI0035638C21